MDNIRKIEVVLEDKKLAPELRTIAQKVFNEERISEEEGLYLFDHAELGYLGTLANYMREKIHGDNTYFNRNFHM